MAEQTPSPTDGSDAPAGTDVQLFDPRVVACPHAAYKSLRDTCPVSRNPLTGGVLIARYDDVMWALKHPEVFSSAVESLSIGQKRPMIPLQLDPPEQSRYRKILDPLFSRRKMRVLESDMRERAIKLIDAFAKRGRCDYNAEFAVPLPSAIFLALIGLPYEDLDAFLEIKDAILRPQVQTDDFAEALTLRDRAGQRSYDYFDKILDERERSPREDILSWMLRAEVDGEKLTRDQILDICYLLLLAGLDTVTATLDCFTAYLAANPDRRKRLVENPKVIESAVEEMLRTETPVMMVVRQIKQDCILSGVQLKKGENAALLLGAADTDERFFEGSEEVDFERRSNRHVAFGAGPHRCLGSHLARLELCIALEEFHKRIPDYCLQEGAELVYSPGIRQVLNLPLEFDAS
ncbi:MAG: cytochrome P450 [Myxococcota bacterium]